ncbi:TPA: hypothetical protein U2C70_001064 [Streptococcus suis]|nr:hypothetical protein [Streptococcus suis]
MKKVMIIGCPGAGKSTFSLKLKEITELPLYHLDQLNWLPDKTTVAREVFQARQKEVLRQEEWIVDGLIGGLMNFEWWLVIRYHFQPDLRWGSAVNCYSDWAKYD